VALLALCFPFTTSAQDVRQLVVGVAQQGGPWLICRSPASRNAMIVHLIQRESSDRLPEGCAVETRQIIVRGTSPGTEVRIPATHTLPSGRVQNLLLPGAFLVGDLLPSGPQNVYVFYYTNVNRVVFPDGRPGPELRDP
jgi:hypothetical protein